MVCSAKLAVGATLTSMTPGSGVIVVDVSRGSGGGLVALDHHRAADPRSRVVDPRDQVDEVLERLGGRHEDVEQPVADLGDHRGGRRGLVVVDLAPSARRRVQLVADRGRVGVEPRPRRLPADRVQRQPQPRRRVAVQQHDAAAPQSPVGAGPAEVVVAAVQRQHEGRGGFGGFVEACQQFGAARGGVSAECQVEIGVRCNRVTLGQADFGRQPRQWIFVSRPHLRRRQAQTVGDRGQQVLGGGVGCRRAGPDRCPRDRPAVSSSGHSGCPSVRQYSPICQRGNGSPGYHLPCLRWTSPCGAHRAFSRAASSEARSRLCGPSASVVHSGSTWLSIETNVGSPPTVSRTSPAASRLSTRARRPGSSPTPRRCRAA